MVLRQLPHLCAYPPRDLHEKCHKFPPENATPGFPLKKKKALKPCFLREVTSTAFREKSINMALAKPGSESVNQPALKSAPSSKNKKTLL